jgi:hypothetical protein
MRLILKILPLLVLTLPSVVTAQEYAVDKGSMIVRGSASILSAGGEARASRVTQISLAPGLAYFVAPHVAIGGTLRILTSSAGSGTDTQIGIGPSISYHFGTAESKTFPFIEFSTDFISVSDAFTQVALKFIAGVDVMIFDNISIGPALTFEQKMRSREGSDATLNGTEIFLGVGFRAWVF